MSRPSGRRPGDSGTREAIRGAAGRQFAEHGYDRTSLRSVAAEAGVDPALVAHFFGTKQRLFVDVVQLPFEPATTIPGLFAGERDSIGERVATFLIGVLDDPEGRRRMTGLLRAAATEPEAAVMVRELLTQRLLVEVIAAIGADHPDLRAGLAGSQVLGLVMARYVIGIEPLASLPSAAVVAAIAPTLQRYLAEPLGAVDLLDGVQPL